MASTRELWLLLRARDEASRVVTAFSHNLKAASLAAQAAAKQAEATAVRQEARQLKTNSAMAQTIRLANEEARSISRRSDFLNKETALEKQRLNSMNASSQAARELAKGEVRRALSIEENVKALRFDIASRKEQLDIMHRSGILSLETVRASERAIKSDTLKANSMAALAATHRTASRQILSDIQDQELQQKQLIKTLSEQSAVLRAQAAEKRNIARATKIALDEEVRALEANAGALDKEAAALRKSAADTRDKERAIQRLTQSLGKVREASTLAAFSFGVMGLAGLTSLKGAINTAVEYENQVRKTFTQVDEGRGTLEELHDAGIRVANNIAVPFATVQESLFDIFGSMEVEIKDAEKLLTSFSKAAVAGQTDIASASRATIGIMNAFNIPAKNINDILDVQFQLVKEGIGSYEEWNTRIGLVTPSAVRAGQSLETMAGALAASTRFSIPAARSATAVSRAMDAMSHPAAVKAMKNLGVEATYADGKFRPLVDVFGDLKSKLDKLPEAKRLQTLLEIFKGAGGTIEARRFLQNVLLTNEGFNIFSEQVDNMKGASGSFEEAYDKMAETTAMQSIVLNNKWQIMKETIGRALIPAFLELINAASKVLDWFNELPSGTQETITKVLLFGSIILTVTGIIFGIVTLLAVFAAAIVTVGVVSGLAIAGLALIPIALAALAVGIAYAAQKSEKFRDFLGKLWERIMILVDGVKTFAQEIRQAFSEHLEGPLSKVVEIFNTTILPIITKLSKELVDTLIPKIQEAGRIIRDLVEGALKYLGMAIEYVTPKFKEFADWLEKNQDKIKPLIWFLGQLVKWILIIGAVVALLNFAVLITAIAAVIAIVALLVYGLRVAWSWIKTLFTSIVDFFNFVGKHVSLSSTSMIVSFTGAWNSMKTSVSRIGNQIKTTITTFLTDFKSWFNALPTQMFSIGAKIIAGLVDGIKSMFGSVKGSLSTLTANIADWKGPEATDKKLLTPAGQMIIQGLIEGFNNKREELKNALHTITNMIVGETKSELEISSPSKKMTKVGAEVVRGLTNGINSSRKVLSDALYKMNTSITRALSDRQATKGTTDYWRNRMNTVTRELLALESKRATVQERLAKAEKDQAHWMSVRNKLSEKVRDSLIKAADLSTLDEGAKVSAQSMIEGLKQRESEMNRFVNNLNMLSKRGLDRETLAELAEQGVDSAGAMVEALMFASEQELRELSTIQNRIKASAGTMGNRVADNLYGAGLKAGQGFIDGLKAQEKAITNQMNKIANALVDTIKKSLGIRSPSRVFMEIGKNTAIGYELGFTRKMMDSITGMSELMLLSPPEFSSVGFQPISYGNPNIDSQGGEQKIITNNINVETQEINPTKNAIDLGWELAQRM